MKIGKLSVRAEVHPTLGKIFVLETANNEDYMIWECEGDQLKIRISQTTALLLAEFIDQEADDSLGDPSNS